MLYIKAAGVIFFLYEYSQPSKNKIEKKHYGQTLLSQQIQLHTEI